MATNDNRERPLEDDLSKIDHDDIGQKNHGVARRLIASSGPPRGRPSHLGTHVPRVSSWTVYRLSPRLWRGPWLSETAQKVEKVVGPW